MCIYFLYSTRSSVVATIRYTRYMHYAYIHMMLMLWWYITLAPLWYVRARDQYSLQNVIMYVDQFSTHIRAEYRWWFKPVFQLSNGQNTVSACTTSPELIFKLIWRKFSSTQPFSPKPISLYPIHINTYRLGRFSASEAAGEVPTCGARVKDRITGIRA